MSLFIKLVKKIISSILCYAILFSLICIQAGSQNLPTSIYRRNDSILLNQFLQLRETKNDIEKLKINTAIRDSLYIILDRENEITDVLDSTHTIGVVATKSNRLKIYTWNVPLMDGSHLFNGFIHYYSKIHKKVFLIELTDKSETIENPENTILLGNNWFGVLYYDIIENKCEDQAIYTLIGYDPNDFFTNKKVIEILTFQDDSIPVFGKPIIHYNQYREYRLIFEYSTKASMSLRYDSNLKMIVFDHLSPSKPSLVGKFQFYGPDFSYDGLKFEDEQWIYYPNIDARN